MILSMKDKAWFYQRVGKRLFRDTSTCDCKTCKDVVENGIVVHDEIHAEYLFMSQCDFAADGVELNYRDVK